MARRLVVDSADAEDLVQDTLLAGLLAGREDPAWLAGVMRRQALFVARTAARRRRRERLHGGDDAGAPAAEEHVEASLLRHEAASGAGLWLRGLPRAPRQIAILALHGLAPEEIRWLLRLTPMAFRQRLTSLRRHLSRLPATHRQALGELTRWHGPARSVALPFGRLRRTLKAGMRGQAIVGSHDPDGHPLLIRSDAHTSAGHGNH